jgi:hypothetical protein
MGYDSDQVTVLMIVTRLIGYKLGISRVYLQPVDADDETNGVCERMQRRTAECAGSNQIVFKIMQNKI